MSEDFTSRSDKDCHIGGYKLLSTIGKGSFAKVMLARHVVTGTEVAVKIVNRQGSSLGFRELHCLKSLNHPNITKLFEVIVTEDQYFLFMEHMSGGQLFDYLENSGAQTEEDARTLFRQLVSALHYCHQKGFVHRDLKPENILLDAENNVKLADFGFSKEFSNNKLSTFCGTVSYMAPEILRNQPYDGPKVDIWSLGVILYKMVTGRLPFVGHNFGEVKRQVLRGHFLVPYFISEECQHLLRKMITLDPAQRPTLDAIIKHPWVNTGQRGEVKLYREPLWSDIDPQVTEKMKHLGFNQEEIKESLAQKKFNNIMGTYLILYSTKMKIKGHTVRVSPYSFPDQRRHLSTTPQLRAAGEKTNKSSSSPPNVAARVAVPTTNLSVRVAVPAISVPTTTVEVKLAVLSASTEAEVAIPNTSVEVKLAVPSATTKAEVAIPNTSVEVMLAVPSASTAVEVSIPTTSREPRVDVCTTCGEVNPAIQRQLVTSRTTCPLPCPESRAATPSFALQHGSWGSFTTPSSALQIGSSASLATTSSRMTSTWNASSSTRSSSSHHSEGREQGRGRDLPFFLKVFCCRPSLPTHKKLKKRTKVHPRFSFQLWKVKIGPQ